MDFLSSTKKPKKWTVNSEVKWDHKSNNSVESVLPITFKSTPFKIESIIQILMAINFYLPSHISGLPTEPSHLHLPKLYSNPE